MRVFRVVIFLPVIDSRERGSGVGKRIDTDIVALESLHEGFGHTAALNRCQSAIGPCGEPGGRQTAAQHTAPSNP